MQSNLLYTVTVVQFYGLLGPGYTFDLAFQHKESNKVYEGLFWYPMDDTVQAAMVLEANALNDPYKDNFLAHPHYQDYLLLVMQQMPTKEQLQAEVAKKSGGVDEI